MNRVLYGNAPDSILAAVDSNPAAIELYQLVGEHILFLCPSNDHWDIISGYTPGAELDAGEKEILDIVKNN